jgi:hypothetical protein
MSLAAAAFALRLADPAVLQTAAQAHDCDPALEPAPRLALP